MPLPADEGEHWSPVNLAKFGNSCLRLLFISCRVRARQNDAPACGHEARLAEAVTGGLGVHRSRSSHFIGCHASFETPARDLGNLSVKSEVFLKLRPAKPELEDDYNQRPSVL